jgi:hypothetical protein
MPNIIKNTVIKTNNNTISETKPQENCKNMSTTCGCGITYCGSKLNHNGTVEHQMWLYPNSPSAWG